jgi:hypothetical protein
MLPLIPVSQSTMEGCHEGVSYLGRSGELHLRYLSFLLALNPFPCGKEKKKEDFITEPQS